MTTPVVTPAVSGADDGWPEFRFPALVGVLVVLVGAARVVGLSEGQATMLVLAGCVLGAAGARVRVAAVAAAAGWALVTGFVVHHHGELTFTVDDLVRLLLYVGAGAGTAWCSRQERPLGAPAGRG